MSELRRYWINAPSKLQPDHKHHGKRVLADTNVVYVQKIDNRALTYAYFVEGDKEHDMVDVRMLAPGWPEHVTKGVLNAAIQLVKAIKRSEVNGNPYANHAFKVLNQEIAQELNFEGEWQDVVEID